MPLFGPKAYEPSIYRLEARASRLEGSSMPTRKLCRAASKPLSLGQAWQAGAVQIARIVQLAAPDGKWLLLLALSSRRLAKPGDAILPQPVPAQRSGGYSRRRRMMRLGEHQDHHIAPPDERCRILAKRRQKFTR